MSFDIRGFAPCYLVNLQENDEIWGIGSIKVYINEETMYYLSVFIQNETQNVGVICRHDIVYINDYAQHTIVDLLERIMDTSQIDISGTVEHNNSISEVNSIDDIQVPLVDYRDIDIVIRGYLRPIVGELDVEIAEGYINCQE